MEKTPKGERNLAAYRLKIISVLMTVLLVVSIVPSIKLVQPAYASEPTLHDILDSLGFTDRAEVSLQTFKPGNYKVTQYAKYAGDGSNLQWYPVPDSKNKTKICDFQGNGILNPPQKWTFGSISQFGLSMHTWWWIFSYHDWYTQRSLNGDSLQHVLVYQDLTYPNRYLIGFEDDHDWDYNDVVFALEFQPANSSTTISCSSPHVLIGSPVSCTASVSGYVYAAPSGMITWSSSSATGSFSQPDCTLSSGSCSTNYTDTSEGVVAIDATYSGDLNNTPSKSLRHTLSAGENFTSVQSEFDGRFLEGLSFINTFGVYTSYFNESVICVYGILDGERYDFINPAEPRDSHNLSLDMGSVKPNSILEVYADYPGGRGRASYRIDIVRTPFWLLSLITDFDVDVEEEISGQWNNTYTVNITKEFDLSYLFNANISLDILPEFAGGGDFRIFPRVKFEFSFDSDPYANSTFLMSCSVPVDLPPLEFGAATISGNFAISASGVFVLQNSSIVWVNASFRLEVGVSGSVNIPIAGHTFDTPFGNVTIGLSATVSIDTEFGVGIVLAPTQNESRQFIKGVGMMIQSVTGDISFEVELAINVGIGVASISGGASLGFTMLLQAEEPYILGGNVTGTVFINYNVLIWSGTIWSATGKLWNWSADPNQSVDPTSDFALIPRYYDTPDYQEFTWTDGSWNGTAVHNMYPFTKISACSNSDNSYILYTTDNLSMTQQQGLCWTGLKFNSEQRTLNSLPPPPVTDGIFFDPTVINLPNGTLLGMWNFVPFSEMSGATSPFDINETILQYSCFDTDTESWCPMVNLQQGRVATSYLLSTDTTDCYALILEGDSLFSSNQSLVEYALIGDLKLLDLEVANISNIVSFNSLAQVAVLRTLDGSYELLNLSTSAPINIPSMNACQVKNVQLALNSTDSLGILYSNSTSNIFAIYNFSSGIVNFTMNLSQSTSYLTLARTESGYQLVTADTSGITSYAIENQVFESSALYPIQNITFMGSIFTDHGILVYTTENYGNSTHPLLDFSLTFIPTQYLVTFGQSGVDTDFNGTVVTVDGKDFTLNEFPVSFWWDAGSLHNYSYASPLSLKTGEQYAWTNTTGLSTLQSDTLKILSPGNVTADYMLQYYLNVTSDYDSPTPLSGWFENGTMINESVTPTVTYSGQSHICTGWTGTGSIPASGNESSVTFTITAPSTITWNWKTINICDVNDDSAVDILDICIAAEAFGSSTGDPRWNARADVNRDSQVDIRDISLIARNFGWTT